MIKIAAIVSFLLWSQLPNARAADQWPVVLENAAKCLDFNRICQMVIPEDMHQTFCAHLYDSGTKFCGRSRAYRQEEGDTSSNMFGYMSAIVSMVCAGIGMKAAKDKKDGKFKTSSLNPMNYLSKNPVCSFPAFDFFVFFYVFLCVLLGFLPYFV